LLPFKDDCFLYNDQTKAKYSKYDHRNTMFFCEVPFSQLFLAILWSFSTIIISLVSVVSLPNNESVPALFVFGDSILDTGNNDYIETFFKCNFPPYGEDFGGENQPTGRFSNGLIPSDFLGKNKTVTL